MKQGMMPGQEHMSEASDQPWPPEWLAVWDAINASLSSAQEGSRAFSGCTQLEVYTDGSAPLVNPGGPAGFSCVLVSFKEPIDPTTSSRPQPVARVDLAGHIPARTTDPQTSNNRAELAGVLAALLAFQHLALQGYTGPEVTIWSDSDLTVKCGNGEWSKKKNTDLWQIFDDLIAEAKDLLPCPVALRWLRGHAGSTFNEAADNLATLAALDFDQDRHARFRAAQAATGREMPGRAAIGTQVEPPEPPVATAKIPLDYSIVVDTGPSSSGGLVASHYLLRTRTGQSLKGTVTRPRVETGDEAGYRTLLTALRNLLGRIEARGKEPETFSLQISSSQEVVIKQLNGSYRVKAATLVPLFTETKGLLGRFKEVELAWRPNTELKKLMKP
jgi:ribonuclease HI